MPKRSLNSEVDCKPLEGNDNKRSRKTVEQFTVDTNAKKKELKFGSGISLKDIPAIAKELKKRPAKGYDYYLDSLHCLMYGFASNESNRRKNVLDFNGFPKGTNRDAKRKQMLQAKYTHNACFLIKYFLTTFQLDAKGTKDSLVDRLLDFMFEPRA